MRHLKAALPALIAAINLVSIAPQAAHARTFGDSIGLNVKFSQGEPQSDLPLLKELGVRWVRDGVSWPEIEPAVGQYADFLQPFKERLAFYRENNIGICFLLAYENAKAYPATPDKPLNSVNAPAFGGYAAQVARRLKASGVRFVLEIWNEPHNFVLQKLAGGEWNAKPPSPWVDHYVSMVGAAVRQVKAIDPDIRLLSDEDMWISHYWFLGKGLPKELDGFAVHPYWGESIGPEMAAVGQETNWTRPFVVVDADRSLQSAVRRLREQGQKKMGRAPGLWATEWGAAIGNKTPYSTLTPDGKATEEAIAAYIPRGFITAAHAGIEATMWFSSYDSVDGPMGLRENSGQKRKAFGAFKTMSQQLAPLSLSRHLVGADHLTSGVQAYFFSAPPNSKEPGKVVLWNIDGVGEFALDTGAEALGQAAQGALRIVDLQGEEVPVKRRLDGRLLITLSQSPIYISGLSDDISLQPVIAVAPVAPRYFFP